MIQKHRKIKLLCATFLIVSLATAAVFTTAATATAVDDSDNTGKIIIKNNASIADSYDTLTQAIKAINESSASNACTVELSKDEVLSELLIINANRNITITSSGNTVYTIRQNGDCRHFMVEGSLTLTNVILEGLGSSSGSGVNGGIDLQSGNLTINNGTVIRKCYNGGNVTGGGGGIITAGNSTFIMNGGVISNNKANNRTNHGGGVLNMSVFTMNGGVIRDNEAGYGGGVFNAGTMIMNSNAEISNNTAFSGGGVAIETTLAGVTAKLTVNGGAIINNKTYGIDGGGGVYVRSGVFAMSNGTIAGNTTDGDGGGVYVYYNGEFTMSGGSITGNKADYDGGGIFTSLYSYATTPNANSSYRNIYISNAAVVSGNTAGTKSAYPSNWQDFSTRAIMPFNGKLLDNDNINYYLNTFWEPYYYEVAFNANNGTGTMANQMFIFGVSQQLNAQNFTRAGFIFAGWATTAAGEVAYKNKESVANLASEVGEVITLFAVWTPDNGSSTKESVTDKNGSLVISNSGETQEDDAAEAELIIEEAQPPLRLFTSNHIAYMLGYPDGCVQPGNNITRAEAAAAFFRLLEDDVRTENWTQENMFQDVNSDDWFNNAVSVMSNMGILYGYSDGTFKPNGAVTRAELAAIAVRFARIMDIKGGNNNSLSDIYGHWAEDDIIFATSIGWVNGYPDGDFKPDIPVTRAEFMTIVNRMMGRIPQTPDDLLADEMAIWSDNADINAWFYLAVQEATNSHIPEYREEIVPGLVFQYEYWVEILDNPDWNLLETQWSQLN